MPRPPDTVPRQADACGSDAPAPLARTRRTRSHEAARQRSLAETQAAKRGRGKPRVDCVKTQAGRKKEPKVGSTVPPFAGEVSERLKERDWKSRKRATVSGVRIPPSPLDQQSPFAGLFSCACLSRGFATRPSGSQLFSRPRKRDGVSRVLRSGLPRTARVTVHWRRERCRGLRHLGHGWSRRAARVRRTSRAGPVGASSQKRNRPAEPADLFGGGAC